MVACLSLDTQHSTARSTKIDESTRFRNFGYAKKLIRSRVIPVRSVLLTGDSCVRLGDYIQKPLILPFSLNVGLILWFRGKIHSQRDE